MDTATRELKGFCGDVDAVLGELLASKGFSLIGSSLGSERAECDYHGQQADLRFYYFRPDGEVNCLIKVHSGEPSAEWRYLTKHLNWGADFTDEEWAEETVMGDFGIKSGLRFYGTLLGELR